MFDKDYILTKLASGASIEDIGNDFAKLLNETKAEYEADQKRKNEKVDRVAELLELVIEVFNDYWPKLLDTILPEDEYDLDETAETLVHAMDDTYDEVFVQPRHGSLWDTIAAIVGDETGSSSPVVEKDVGADGEIASGIDDEDADPFERWVRSYIGR